MKLSPSLMSLYQLKNAIAYFKRQIETHEKDLKKGKPDQATEKRINSVISRYQSGLKIHEFMLQRKTDELKVNTTVMDIKRIRKNTLGLLDGILNHKFEEETFNEAFKRAKSFIQNYNEL